MAALQLVRKKHRAYDERGWIGFADLSQEEA
jgi:hypothetical protein